MPLTRHSQGRQVAFPSLSLAISPTLSPSSILKNPRTLTIDDEEGGAAVAPGRVAV